MKIITTPLSDCFVIDPNVIIDYRGYFFESFNQKTFEKLTSQNGHFIQDNQSKSNFGVVRGLHAQTGEYAQAKLVRVLSGVIWDVAVDIRPNSPTYKKWFGVELSAENKYQLYIPKGFLHGFSVLSKTAEVAYKVDAEYARNAEYGVKFDEPSFNIDWKLEKNQIILSEKDAQLNYFSN